MSSSPATTDGVGFTRVTSDSGGVGGFGIPPVHGKLGIATSTHRPVEGVIRHQTTHIASKFLQRCRGSTPNASGQSYCG